MAALPPEPFLSAFVFDTTKIVRRVELYESDGVTPYCLQMPVTGGGVSIDIERDERRSFDISVSNEGCAHGGHYFAPGHLWYDKIVKLYRGIEYRGDVWETQIGEFMIDNMDQPHFPRSMKINGRDYTKKLLEDKFPATTTFVAGSPVENVIRTIATNGGITRFILPVTGKVLDRDYPFEADSSRWKAIYEIALAFNYEVYFDERGFLVMREHQDPTFGIIRHTFQTGPHVGNLASYNKRSSDSRIKNHIVVVGDNPDLSVWAESENNDPDSPTRIAKLGRRTWRHTSSLITDEQQAQDLADAMLRTRALESFDLNFGSLVAPWLEGGDVVEFIDPNPSPGDPTRFLLVSTAIPLGLEQQRSNGRRLTNVG